MSEAEEAFARESDPPGAGLAEIVVVAIVSVLLILALAWPLPAHLADQVASDGGWGTADVDLVGWVLAWGAHGLTTAPSDVFQANIFHPAPDTLALAENMLGLAPVTVPAFAWTGEANVAQNVAVLVVSWLGVWLTWVAARGLGAPPPAAAVATVMFALAPVHLLGFGRLHTTAVHFFPLIVLVSVRLWERPGLARGLGLGLMTTLQALAGVYVAFELVVLLGGLAPVALREGRRAFIRWAGALVVGFAPVGLVALPYLRQRSAGVLSEYTGDGLAQVAVPVSIPWTMFVDAVTVPGIVLGVLGLFLAAFPTAVRLGLGGVALFGLWMSLGPAVPGPFGFAQEWVPGFASIRAPTRFVVVPVLATAILAGGAAAWLPRKLGRAAQWLTCGLLVAWLVTMRPLPDVKIRPARAAAPQTLAVLVEQGEGRPLLEWPVANSVIEVHSLLDTTGYMMDSTRHWLPLLNGYSGHTPASAGLLMTLAQRLPDPTAWEQIRELVPVGWLRVWRAPGDQSRWQRLDGLRLAASESEATLYEVAGGVRPASPSGLQRPDEDRTFGGTLRVPLSGEGVSGTLAPADPDGLPHVWTADEFLWLWFDVSHGGTEPWPGYDVVRPGTVGLRARWRDALRGEVVRVSPWVPLARDLAPTERMSAQVGVYPPAPGDYWLEVGLGQVGSGWWADQEGGVPLVRSRVRVEARRGGGVRAHGRS